MQIRPCRDCPRVIRLVPMPSGKFQPCERDAAYLVLDGGKQVGIRTDDQRQIRGTLHAQRPNDQAVQVWIPHWPNCPAANRFRRRSPDRHPPPPATRSQQQDA